MARAVACAFTITVVWSRRTLVSYSLICTPLLLLLRVQGELNQYNQQSRADLSKKLPAKVPELTAARL